MCNIVCDNSPVMDVLPRFRDMNIGNINSRKVTTIKERLHSSIPLDTKEIKDWYKASPFEKCSIIEDLYQAVIAVEEGAIDKVITPIGGEEGSGVNGSYFVRNLDGKKLFVFKPASEEKEGVFEGIPVGDGAKREQLASALNRGNVYNIPITTYIHLAGKTGSLQQFVPKTKSIHTLGLDGEEKCASLQKKDIQASLIFDLRFRNSDRHLGNLLAQEDKVFMIDHGGCMSSSCEDLLKIEQMNLPQLLEDFDPSLKEHILSLEKSVEKDAEKMREFGIEESTISWMEKTTSLLVEAVKQSITPYDLGMLIIHQQKEIWESVDCSSQLEFLKDITSEKEKLTSLDPNSKAKIMIARRNYAKVQKDQKLVNLLYGSDPNDTSDRIDFKDSIIYNYLIKK